MRSIISFVVLLAAAQIGIAQGGQGQEGFKAPTLSPQAEVVQEVGLTQVKLSYGRPGAKGRKVFGDLVPFGEVWRTGANASTKLTFTEDVKIEGIPLKAGTYALYTIPGETEWTIIIHSNIRHRAIAGGVYKPEEDVFRFKVKPGKTSNYVETFTIQFGDITTDSLKVALSWENTEVKFRIDFDVHAQVDKQIAALSASPTGLSHQNQFLAAEYYLHNGRDLAKADEWISSAMQKSPKNFRYALLRAKILVKAGKRAEAIKAVAEANAWAAEAKNANYVLQTQLFWDSIKK